MSQPCAVESCKRTSRALCHCCHQNLCRYHLNAHDDLLNKQLEPFVDEINQLNDKLSHINEKGLVDNAHKQLDKWRISAHEIIEHYYSEKRHQLDQHINTKIVKQVEEITRLRAIVTQLIQNQETTIEDLNSISTTMQSIRREITQIEYKSIELIINQLEIDDRSVQIGDEHLKQNFNLSTLIPPVHTIPRPAESSKPVASNNKHLLLHHDNQLCLLNQDLTSTKYIPWAYGWIWDMCWSTTLSRFFIITLNEIFMLYDETMLLEHLTTKEKYSLCSCTCSDTSFYITTNELGSSICEFNLLPTIELNNQWQPADLCQKNEIIQDMIFHQGTLAFIIENQTSHTKRMELRLAQTFHQLWSIQFDIVDPLHNAYRLCLFNYNEWIVIDWKSSQLFYIKNDGRIESTCIYDSIPYRCCQFGSNILAMSTKNCINFHKIKS